MVLANHCLQAIQARFPGLTARFLLADLCRSGDGATAQGGQMLVDQLAGDRQRPDTRDTVLVGCAGQQRTDSRRMLADLLASVLHAHPPPPRSPVIGRLAPASRAAK